MKMILIHCFTRAETPVNQKGLCSLTRIILCKRRQPCIRIVSITKNGVNVMHMAPTVLNGIIDKFVETKPQIEQNVRIVLAGAAPPQAFIKQVEEEIGWEFYQVYGMTESSPLSLASYMSSEDTD